MAKALAGVKYGKMSSQRGAERPHTKGKAKGSGKTGGAMVSIGSQSGPGGGAHRFARTGSVSQRRSHSGPSDHPSIGKQSSPKGGVGPFK
jgi:hypothetical protein